MLLLTDHLLLVVLVAGNLRLHSHRVGVLLDRHGTAHVVHTVVHAGAPTHNVVHTAHGGPRRARHHFRASHGSHSHLLVGWSHHLIIPRCIGVHSNDVKFMCNGRGGFHECTCVRFPSRRSDPGGRVLVDSRWRVDASHQVRLLLLSSRVGSSGSTFTYRHGSTLSRRGCAVRLVAAGVGAREASCYGRRLGWRGIARVVGRRVCILSGWRGDVGSLRVPSKVTCRGVAVGNRVHLRHPLLHEHVVPHSTLVTLVP